MVDTIYCRWIRWYCKMLQCKSSCSFSQQPWTQLKAHVLYRQAVNNAWREDHSNVRSQISSQRVFAFLFSIFCGNTFFIVIMCLVSSFCKAHTDFHMKPASHSHVTGVMETNKKTNVHLNVCTGIRTVEALQFYSSAGLLWFERDEINNVHSLSTLISRIL